MEQLSQVLGSRDMGKGWELWGCWHGQTQAERGEGASEGVGSSLWDEFPHQFLIYCGTEALVRTLTLANKFGFGHGAGWGAWGHFWV